MCVHASPTAALASLFSAWLAISLFGTIAPCLLFAISPLHFFYFRPSSRLPERTRDKILKFVQQDLFGEQQPGTAFIVKNTGKGEKYKYVAFLSLVRVADAPHPVEFAYTALRGLLLAIIDFNQKKEGPSIEVVAIPSFAVNNTPEHKRYVSISVSILNMVCAKRRVKRACRSVPRAVTGPHSKVFLFFFLKTSLAPAAVSSKPCHPSACTPTQISMSTLYESNYCTYTNAFAVTLNFLHPILVSAVTHHFAPNAVSKFDSFGPSMLELRLVFFTPCTHCA